MGDSACCQTVEEHGNFELREERGSAGGSSRLSHLLEFNPEYSLVEGMGSQRLKPIENPYRYRRSLINNVDFFGGSPIITIEQGPEMCVTKDYQQVVITIRKSESEPLKCLLKTESPLAIEFEHYLPLHQELILENEQTNVAIELIQNDSADEYVTFNI